jgi:hypothetical protein
MATRTTFTGGSGAAGTAYMTNVADHIGVFYDASALRLTSIGGTADAVTAVVDPVLDAGLVAGMGFWFTATSTSTGPMTMVIGSEAAVAITDAAAAALAAGAVVSGTTYKLMFDGTRLLLMTRNPEVVDPGAFVQYDVITFSGSLVKPTAFPADGLVIIEAWGGGGGGGTGSAGGGGGGFNRGVFRGADLGASETVTIGAGGAGGAPGVSGGNTTVGSLLFAGGGGGGGITASFGGGGGGQLSGSVSGAAATPFPGVGSAGDKHGNCGAGVTGAGVPGGDGIFGGGGGSQQNVGGRSLFGGGGGGFTGGGASVFGGAGGTDSVAGSIPAGGGGRNAAGARGEVRVRWIG